MQSPEQIPCAAYRFIRSHRSLVDTDEMQANQLNINGLQASTLYPQCFDTLQEILLVCAHLNTLHTAIVREQNELLAYLADSWLNKVVRRALEQGCSLGH